LQIKKQLIKKPLLMGSKIAFLSELEGVLCNDEKTMRGYSISFQLSGLAGF
jgi:hypothetical protein